jgi:acyl CoA:acetate/3-ketoacid CoA transferase alpha subunit
MALVAEIVRQAIEGLTVLGWTLGIETELLLNQLNVVSAVRTSYFGLDLFGIAPAYRRCVEANSLSVIEETETTLGFGLRAALQGVDFLPARTLLGTDILKVRPDIEIIASPYSKHRYPAIPKIVPDVAVIHVPLADVSGNSVLYTNFGVDSELALLAKYTIISAEEVVPRADQRFHEHTRILGRSVDAVVESDGGAWPTSCFPNYPIDAGAIVDYLEAWQMGTEEMNAMLGSWMEKLEPC